MQSNSAGDPRKKQPEEGRDDDLNLTNNDASLIRQGNRQQPDAPTMNDSAANVNSENLTPTARKDGEVNP